MVGTGDILKVVLRGPAYRLAIKETKGKEKSVMRRIQVFISVGENDKNKDHDMKSYLVEAYGWKINDFNKMIGLLSQ